MESSTLVRNVFVTNPGGLNLRGSVSVRTLIGQFRCKVEIVKPPQRVSAVSILDLLCLAAYQGTQLSLEANGEEAEAALSALEKLFAENFGQSDSSKTHAALGTLEAPPA